jgi:hypothetical protein
MANSSLPNCFFFVERNTYRTKYESLRAKLYQSCTVANLAINANTTEGELFHALWCVADLLNRACGEFETLKASDLESSEH